MKLNPRPVFALFSLLFFAAVALLRAQPVSPVRVDALTCEHETNPLGIGVAQPRLSWKLRSARLGEKQTAYEIRAASSAAALAAGKSDAWATGKIASDQSVFVPWGGPALGSRARIFWQVRAWDKDGIVTAWSAPASFELGLLAPATDWKGQWITIDLPRYDVMQPPLAKASWINAGSASDQTASARFVLELPANAKILGATIDAAADGLLSLYVNGQATKQGATSHTAPFHAEFGPHLNAGKNVIAINAAAVRLSRGGGKNALAAHGVIELAGGPRIEFNTDGAWKAAVAPAEANWFAPDFDDSKWAPATVLGPYSTTAISDNAGGTVGPGRYLRKGFSISKPVAKARLYATALGVYEASINGRRVSDHELDPGFTDYNQRVMVQTTDVTALIKPGANAIGALLSDGWFAGRVGWMGLFQYKNVATHPLFSAQLELTYADGTSEVIATDSSWKGGSGEIVGSDMQLGEVIDARAAAPWDQPAFDDTKWAAVSVESHPSVALDPQRGPPVRRLMELAPKKITRRGHAWIVDFGQNLVGHVRLSARGRAGTTITVTHAEMFNDKLDTLYAENLRTAISLDTFTLAGRGRETFEPHFTFHGFRYAEIVGYPGELAADDIRGIVVGSDTPATGTWESSDQDLNQLFSNIVWGQRGNFLSVPTDCPQRDERLGWMGDAQVFAPTAARNADVSGFFTKWMVDVNDAQGPKGEFRTVSPHANQTNSWPVWGDAGVIIPWVMFTSYGDRAFLAANYDHMAKWVDYCASVASNFILTGGVGDHLAPKFTPTPIVDTAYFANSARIVARAATLLGQTGDAARFEKLHADIVAAFNQAFVGADGTITAVAGARGRAPEPYPSAPTDVPRTGNTQTAYLLALQFDLVPETLRPVVAKRLADDVAQAGHLTTGFVGVGLICPTLTRIGRSDLAWSLVFNDSYPSWLFSVKNGATTIWERWDGWTPEKGFQDSSMNSFNHYSLGSVGAWLYSGAAGIVADEANPGYKHFTLAPQFTPRLTHVKATLDTPYGTIASHWHAEGDQMIYDITVPPNTTADLVLPVSATNLQSVSSGTHRFSFPRALIK